MPDALLAREKYVIRQLHQNYRVPDQPASFTEPVGPGLNSLFVLTVDGVNGSDANCQPKVLIACGTCRASFSPPCYWAP